MNLEESLNLLVLLGNLWVFFKFSEKWTIQPARFDGDILGTAETKDMFINDQRVYDLNKAAGIFDHIHAVKLSAQVTHFLVFLIYNFFNNFLFLLIF